jgi:CRP-like cAMP-binding protein
LTAVSDNSSLASSFAEPGSRAVRILDVDPDLAEGVPSTHVQLAAGAAVAHVHCLPRGPWAFDPPDDPAGLGGLVLTGLILVRLEIAGRCHAELLGEGDVISPWLPAGLNLAAQANVTARVIEPVEIALLDRHFALRTARWPEIQAALMRRLLLRSRRLSLQSAINSIPRTQDRLELTLWQLAYRYGRVVSGGLRLHLPMSHAQIAEIIATQRPSVTIALSRLQAAGRLRRVGPHDWLLCGPDPTELGALAVAAGIES